MVGDNWFARFALGAASGSPRACSSPSATGCAGTRTATVSAPAVTIAGTAAHFGNTSVNGPGQKCSANCWASLGQVRGQLASLLRVGHMHDQRIVARSAFGGKNPGHRRGIQRIGAQAINRLGWKGHKAAAAQISAARRTPSVAAAAAGVSAVIL